MIIIGITGTNGAGKGTVAEYLVENKNFYHLSAREFIIEEITRRGSIVDRESMINIGNEWRAKYGTSYIAEKLYEKALRSNKNCVIESIRNVGEIEALRKKEKFYLMAVDASPLIRYQRIMERNNKADIVSYEDFLKYEKEEASSEDPTKVNLYKCIELADFVVNNDGTLDELKIKIDKWMQNI